MKRAFWFFFTIAVTVIGYWLIGDLALFALFLWLFCFREEA